MTTGEAFPHTETKQKLPPGWRWLRLGEVCEIIAGQSPPSDTYRKTPEGLAFFQGKADFGPRHPVARIWCVAPTKVALPGDILVSVRAPVGPTNVADVECCIGRGLAAIRPGEQVDRDFVLAALRLLQGKIAELGSGSTFQAIKRDDLESLEIPTPPLAVQKRIAAILNEQMAAVERARAAAKGGLEAAKALPAAYLRAVYNSPESQQWPRSRLGDVCKLVNGDAYRESDWSHDGVPIVRIQNLNNARKPFNCWAGSLEGRVVVNSGDVLLAWSGTPGTSFGAHLWELGLAVLNQHIFRVDLDHSRVDSRWAVGAINEQLDLMIGKAHGAVGLRHVTKGEVEALTIPLPLLADQQRIVAHLAEQMAAAERTRKALEDQLVQVNALPAALLRRAFSGEL